MLSLMGRLKLFLILSWFLTFFLLTGCSSDKQEPNKSASPPITTQTQTSADKQPVVSDKTVEWKPDGVITDNEYSKMQVLGEIEVYSRMDGDKIRMALKAKTNGYVAIGFDPAERMKNADIILGFVKDGKAVVADMYSTGPTGPHPVDDQQGGKNDVTGLGGSKKDGVTILEFERKLATGDPKDKEIVLGENKVIWAIGDEETFSAKHTKRGSGVVKF